MRRLALLATCLALAACSTSAPSDPPPQVVAPPPVVAPRPVADTCGAQALQGLLGHPRSDIPVPVRPELQRVACTTCPMTMDYNPERLNILFDAATGLIREVRCG